MIIIGILVIAAIAYLVRMAYTSFTSSSCESGCGKCNTINVDAILEAADKKTKSTL